MEQTCRNGNDMVILNRKFALCTMQNYDVGFDSNIGRTQLKSGLGNAKAMPMAMPTGQATTLIISFSQMTRERRNATSFTTAVQRPIPLINVTECAKQSSALMHPSCNAAL